MLVLLLAGAVLSAPQPIYKDATQPVNARVTDLLSKMNVEEKVAQLLNPFSSADAIVSAYKHGVGGAWDVKLPGNDKRFSNKWEAQNWLQESIINSSRHSIPVSVYVEGLHGGRVRVCTHDLPTVHCQHRDSLLPRPLGGTG